MLCVCCSFEGYNCGDLGRQGRRDCSNVKAALSGLDRIYFKHETFAKVLKVGILVTWGGLDAGVDSKVGGGIERS